jgi:hypothetical protein
MLSCFDEKTELCILEEYIISKNIPATIKLTLGVEVQQVL